MFVLFCTVLVAALLQTQVAEGASKGCSHFGELLSNDDDPCGYIRCEYQGYRLYPKELRCPPENALATEALKGVCGKGNRCGRPSYDHSDFKPRNSYFENPVFGDEKEEEEEEDSYFPSFDFRKRDTSDFEAKKPPIFETIHGINFEHDGFNFRNPFVDYDSNRRSHEHAKPERKHSSFEDDFEEEVYPKPNRRAHSKFPEERYEDRYSKDEVYEEVPDYDQHYTPPKRDDRRHYHRYHNPDREEDKYDERYWRETRERQHKDKPWERRYESRERNYDNDDEDMMKEVVDTMKNDPDMRVVVTRKNGEKAGEKMRIIEMKKPGVETVIEEVSMDGNGDNPGEKIHGKTMKKTNVEKGKDGQVTRESSSVKYEMVSSSDDEKDVKEQIHDYKPPFEFNEAGFHRSLEGFPRNRPYKTD